MDKVCSRCKISKSLSNFSKRSSNSDGLDYYCRNCKSEYNKSRQFMPDYSGFKVCTECNTEKQKVEFHRDHRRKDGLEGRCKPCNDSRARRNELKRYYGITHEQYDDMYKSQKGKCAICLSNVSDARSKRLNVDHCHTTSLVRGLLCNNCNNGLGRFKDSVELLQSAINYLNNGTKNG